MRITDEKLQEIIAYYVKNGESETTLFYNITNETLHRYVRESNIRGFNITKDNLPRDIRSIIETYTPSEIKAIAKGGRFIPGMGKVPVVDFGGKHIRVGHITDTHIGSLYTDIDRIYQAFEVFKEQKVDFITHSGDVSEGMSNRPGHIYELSALGYDNQKQASIDVFSNWTDTDIYAIDGNHDRWFIKSSGAKIVKDIDDALDNFHFIGHDEGLISLAGKSNLMLWHGEDGSSYALSYRLQKILESLSGGEKPGALVAGHVHKYVSIFERNVYAIGAGAIQRQTKWMRGKRLSAHVGFVVADYWIGDKGITRFGHQWYPFYV